VIGEIEIVGGIVLVPSLLGEYLPGLEDHLFAPAIRGQLNLLGPLGLVLFMVLALALGP
jgi:hypothetical protein